MDALNVSCGRKNPLPFPYSLSSANFALLSKGKGEIHKRVENRRLSILLCPRRGGEIPSLRKRPTPDERIIKIDKYP